MPPPDEFELVNLFSESFTPATRVVSVSAITTRTGLCLPVARIAALARERGITSVVDGAHLPGQVKLDFQALGCDYLAASPHKWLFAPPGSGLLYGRGEGLERLASRLMRTTFRPGEAAETLMQVGTNSGAIFDGYAEGLAFHLALGPDVIHARIHELARHVRKAAQALDDVVLHTPARDSAYGGMVTFGIRQMRLSDLQPFLRSKNIRVAAGERMRVSTHVHTRLQDIDRLFEVINSGLRSLRH